MATDRGVKRKFSPHGHLPAVVWTVVGFVVRTGTSNTNVPSSVVGSAKCWVIK